ncbi:chorismate synthase [Candidatus Woesearchaeota archaeon]|nr:chorismate synthase [Candidatus Woesearchaeota archaeon]
MGNTFGKKLKIMTFGESHGKALGAVIDGVKSNIKISEKDIQKELDKRKPGQSTVTTQRKEQDKVHILSGIFKGRTTGHPICLVVYNKDADSRIYERWKDVFRPGHADFTYLKRYGIHDYRGGGRASGRETVARVAAGAIAKKLTKAKIFAYTIQVGTIKAKKRDLKEIEKNPLRCPDKEAAKRMQREILKIKKQGDSIGGIVEVTIKNCPPGLGNPVFDKLNADLAKAVLSIGAVKGIEFGSGFKAVEMKGSQHNDQLYKKGKIRTRTNNAGGIVAGISNGEDIIFRAAIKPPSSIAKEQLTIDKKGKKVKIKVSGRHDPCLCPRIAPVIEHMTALVLAGAQ